MNAIVGICHFCEAHGPRPVFCTFTTDDEEHTREASSPTAQCNGCRSVGPETVLVSKDEDGTIYCSRESVPNPDVTAFLRQAAVRSITCEVNWSKEGGTVYFSDTRGHVLSLTFQLKDTRARGLKRWFSIVVLMKDKMLLLNITPLLSEHMQEISKELQSLAEKVYDEEQIICSQRALRLNTGSNYFGQSRSLIQLTSEEEIFKKLHSYFTRMLKAGALTYSETLHTSKQFLNRLNPEPQRGVSIFTEDICLVPSSEECMPLRALEEGLGSQMFNIILYCALTGINIIIKSHDPNAVDIEKAISRLLPVTSEQNPRVRSSSQLGIVSSDSTCVLELQGTQYGCRWPGALPSKCPTLMNRILNAMSNVKFADEVLHQHVKSLQLEWLGIARTLKSAMDSGTKSDAVTKLKQVLGVTPHDDILVNHWVAAYCT